MMVDRLNNRRVTIPKETKMQFDDRNESFRHFVTSLHFRASEIIQQTEINKRHFERINSFGNK